MAHIMHERAMLNKTRSPFAQQAQQQQQQTSMHQQQQIIQQQQTVQHQQQQQPQPMQVDQAPQQPRQRPNRWSTNKRTEMTTTTTQQQQQTTKTMSSTMSSTKDQSQVMISEVDPNLEGCVLKATSCGMYKVITKRSRLRIIDRSLSHPMQAPLMRTRLI